MHVFQNHTELLSEFHLKSATERSAWIEHTWKKPENRRMLIEIVTKNATSKNSVNGVSLYKVWNLLVQEQIQHEEQQQIEEFQAFFNGIEAFQQHKKKELLREITLTSEIAAPKQQRVRWLQTSTKQIQQHLCDEHHQDLLQEFLMSKIFNTMLWACDDSEFLVPLRQMLADPCMANPLPDNLVMEELTRRCTWAPIPETAEHIFSLLVNRGFSPDGWNGQSSPLRYCIVRIETWAQEYQDIHVELHPACQVFNQLITLGARHDFIDETMPRSWELLQQHPLIRKKRLGHIVDETTQPIVKNTTPRL